MGGSYFRQLALTGKMGELPVVLDFVERACAQAGIDPALWFDLQLAVEEACSNVIEHAYEGKGGPYTVSIEARDRDALITLRDHGRAFDPAKVAPPNMAAPLEKRRIGGLGLHLIYSLMDEVGFEFSAAGNTLVMIKRGAVLPGFAGDGTSEDITA